MFGIFMHRGTASQAMNHVHRPPLGPERMRVRWASSAQPRPLSRAHG